MSNQQDAVELQHDLLASSEVMLDLFYEAHALLELDLTDTLIVMCVVNASLKRPQSPSLPSVRVVISQRLIAERLGIPRESARRRVRGLADRGVLQMSAHGQVLGLTLDSARLQQLARVGTRAITRYKAWRHSSHDARRANQRAPQRKPID